jgi:hypothetical protein
MLFSVIFVFYFNYNESSTRTISLSNTQSADFIKFVPDIITDLITAMETAGHTDIKTSIAAFNIMRDITDQAIKLLDSMDGVTDIAIKRNHILDTVYARCKIVTNHIKDSSTSAEPDVSTNARLFLEELKTYSFEVISCLR